MSCGKSIGITRCAYFGELLHTPRGEGYEAAREWLQKKDRCGDVSRPLDGPDVILRFPLASPED